MNTKSISWLGRMKIPLTVVVTLVLVAVLSKHLPSILMPFVAPKENFGGGYPILENDKRYRALQLYFPEGVRTNWHSHSEGQLLMVETGVARAQVRGQAVQDIAPGSPWWTAPGVEHWHGAVPDKGVLQLTVYAGNVKWLEPVSDEQYHAHQHLP